MDIAEPLRALCENRNLDWYLRVNAADPVIAIARRQGAAALDAALGWLASLVADEKEDWDFRLCAANTLLDFPRAAHRPLLEALAARQKKPDVHFAPEDIEEAWAAGEDRPGWIRRGDPWQFYTPEAIAARQARWAEEDSRRQNRRDPQDREDRDWDDEGSLPLVRSMPKIGRNDPCPCGSGRKYKKCHGAPGSEQTMH
jgi:hypothetical protein